MDQTRAKLVVTRKRLRFVRQVPTEVYVHYGVMQGKIVDCIHGECVAERSVLPQFLYVGILSDVAFISFYISAIASD
jgi:hypothetical protein